MSHQDQVQHGTCAWRRLLQRAPAALYMLLNLTFSLSLSFLPLAGCMGAHGQHNLQGTSNVSQATHSHTLSLPCATAVCPSGCVGARGQHSLQRRQQRFAGRRDCMSQGERCVQMYWLVQPIRDTFVKFALCFRGCMAEATAAAQSCCGELGLSSGANCSSRGLELRWIMAALQDCTTTIVADSTAIQWHHT